MPFSRIRRPRFAHRVFGLGALLALAGGPAPASGAPDVRVLIDVSGSMQQNDPAQLRVPALRLLTDLLPAGSRAGVWIFDEAVETLAAPADVDAAWKEEARAAAARIDSHGRFTDIEAALATAIADWSGAASDASPRHVLLLTDGMVDVAKDADRSAASRARVLGPQLARLRELGAHVHTIALSAHADHALLDTLAATTGGWSEIMADASALERAFLHLFEQAATPDALPLVGNRFTVDPSVRELTLLVFRGDDAAPLELRDPAGQTHTAADHPGRWRSEAGYDLVTIEAPAAGDWQFTGAGDPDNRALIATDLALDTGELPAHLVAGEPLALRATLTEHGEAVARRDFLDLLRARADAARGDTGAASVPLVLDAAGAFGGVLDTALPAGDYELAIAVDGGTFARERRHRFRVHPAPFTLRHETLDAGAPSRRIVLEVTAVPDVIDHASVAGLVIVSAPGGQRTAHELEGLAAGTSALEIPAAAMGEYLLEPWLFATARSGRSMKLRPAPIALSFNDGTGQPDLAPEPPPLRPWLTASAVIGAGNAGLGSTLGGLWWVARRRRAPAAEPVL